MLDDDPGMILAEDLERRKDHTVPVRFEALKQILNADKDFYANYKNNGMTFVTMDYVAYLLLLALSGFFSYGVFFAFKKFWNVEFTLEHVPMYFIATASFIFAVIFLVPSVKLALNYIFFRLKLNSRFSNQAGS